MGKEKKGGSERVGKSSLMVAAGKGIISDSHRAAGDLQQMSDQDDKESAVDGGSN